MNEEFQIFASHKLMVCNQSALLIHFVPTEGVRNYNIFLYPATSKIVKVHIVGANNLIGVPIMDWEHALEYYFLSLLQLNTILENICYW